MTLDDVTLNLVSHPKYPQSKNLVRIFEETLGQYRPGSPILEVEGTPVMLEDLIGSLKQQFLSLPKALKIPGSKKGLKELEIQDLEVQGVSPTEEIQILLSFLGYNILGYQPKTVDLSRKEGMKELAVLKACGRQKILGLP